jgi:hypothetical protein
VSPERTRPGGRLTLTLVSFLSIACSPAGPVPIAMPTIASGLPGGTAAVPVASPTLEPPRIEPSSHPPPSPDVATNTPPPDASPPDASMAVEGGDPVVGTLGSYTWRSVGSDAPWLRGSPIHVGRGEELEVSFGSPVAIATWTAGRTMPGSLDGSGAIGLGEGRRSPPRFLAPPPGTWSVQVVVWFAANQGSAAYYWLVEVD